MIKKLQVLVREVYEGEEMEVKIRHNKTAQEVSDWDFKSLSEEEKLNYTHGEYPTGKSEVKIQDGDPVYGQIFDEDKLDIKDLILHLNRTK